MSAPTLKKRIGGIQALLSCANEQRWTARNEGRDVPITCYSKTVRQHRPFEVEDLQRLYATNLFLDPASWCASRKVSDLNLYWSFLIATQPARLEEVGRASLSDLKSNGPILVIDIDEYALQPDLDGPKSIKTEGSRRLVPVYEKLIALGFPACRDALVVAGQSKLFPDLSPGQFDERTKEASRAANRYIDKLLSADRRLAFIACATHPRISRLKEYHKADCGSDLRARANRGRRKYGKGVRLPVLHRSLHKVDWSFLDREVLTSATKDLAWIDVVKTLLASDRPDPFDQDNR